MKNKFKMTLCGLLAACMIFSSGCGNKGKEKNISNSNSDTYSSQVNPPIEEERYSDVLLLIAYDEINDINRAYFTQLEGSKMASQDDSLLSAKMNFGDILPDSIIENSKIENGIFVFRSILYPEVTVTNSTLSLVSEEGYEGTVLATRIDDPNNSLIITNVSIILKHGDEVMIENNIYFTDVNGEIVSNYELSIEVGTSDRTYTYEDIVILDNYYKSCFEEQKNESVLEKALV